MTFKSYLTDPLPTVNAPIHDFLFDPRHGRAPFSQSEVPLVCGFSGKSYTLKETVDRIELLARGLAKRMGWKTNQGTEWDKTVCHYSVNALDSPIVYFATLRLGGVQTPANAAYQADELAHQLRSSTAKCLFTSKLQLDVALKAADEVGLDRSKIFLIDLPLPSLSKSPELKGKFLTVDDLVEIGKTAPEVERLKWTKRDQESRVAFLNYSSGTSGLPKGVKIAHRNVIANVLQQSAFQKRIRESRPKKTFTVSCVLPLSHIFGLAVVLHNSLFNGDSIVILPKFELNSYLTSIERFKIDYLFVVPPIILLMLKNKSTMDRFDLSSVELLFTGAAPLGEETIRDLTTQWPGWSLNQGYGLTETSTVVCMSLPDDRMDGSSGCLVPGTVCRIARPDGSLVTGYGESGELWVHSPSVTLGYLDNASATEESYVRVADGPATTTTSTTANDTRLYFRTGDEVLVRKSPATGTEHLFIVDRIKELIKVKAHQVAPAELEAHLLAHPTVADCAVIPVPDEYAGEVPKAYVVLSPEGRKRVDGAGADAAAAEIQKYFQDTKARYKWLTGGIEFTDVIPKSPSGKILRRILRDLEREKGKKKRRQEGAKL